jgi:hypothetical protein
VQILDGIAGGIFGVLRLDCAKLGVLYAKKSEQSPKALPLKIFGVQLSRNFLTLLCLKYKKFHSDDT